MQMLAGSLIRVEVESLTTSATPRPKKAGLISARLWGAAPWVTSCVLTCGQNATIL